MNPPSPLPAPHRRPTGATRLSRSSRDLVALDIEASSEPLYVTVAKTGKKATVQSYDELRIPAKQVDGCTLEDESGQTYHLDRIFDRGVHGVVRYLRKPDPIRDQIYVAKMMRHSAISPPAAHQAPPAEPRRAILFDPEQKKQVEVSAQLIVLDHRLIAAEVNYMLRSNSALAPHAVLSTAFEEFVLLPVLDGTLEQLTAVARHNHIGAKWIPNWNTVDDVPSGVMLPKDFRENLPHLVLAQGAQALADVHEAGIVHRDVKPNNFLFEVKCCRLFLGDFGISADYISHETVAGPPAYLPIEAYVPPKRRSEPYDAAKADIWSLGATTVEVMIQSNLLWPMAAAAKSPRAVWKDETFYRNVVVPFFEAFTLAWHEAYQATKTKSRAGHLVRRPGNPKLLRSGLPKMSRATKPLPTMSELALPLYCTLSSQFELLRRTDPKLMGPLLQALNPDARLRPSAQTLCALIEAAKGEHISGLSALMTETKKQVEAGRRGHDQGSTAHFLQRTSRSSWPSNSVSSSVTYRRSHSEDPKPARLRAEIRR